MDSSCIIYTPRQDATPERELDALAAVYQLIIDRYLQRKAAETSRNSGEKEGPKDEPRH